MLIDISGRKSGKTTRALQWLAASPGTRLLVTPHHREVVMLAGYLYGEDFVRRAVITQPGRDTSQTRGRGLTEAWVDDSDAVIRGPLQYLGVPIVGATINGEVVE